MQLIANLSLLWTELPLPDRFAAAARAGFDGVEIQFPYEHDPEALRFAAGDLPIVLINVPAADGRGGVGRSTDPSLRTEFRTGLDEALRFADALDAAKVNVLPGPPPPGQSDAVTRAVLAENVRLTADRMDDLGVQVLVEAVNPFDVPGFWLDGLEKALGFLDGLDDERVGLQFDLYHMARTEPDLVAAVRQAGGRIAHVQFADTPGRNEPGTGGIDFAAALAAVQEAGYDGAVSAEYRPAGATADGLAWMPAMRRWLGDTA